MASNQTRRSGPTESTATERTGGLRYRGVAYGLADGETPATRWSADRMRADVRAIKDDLHANAIVVLGDGVERLAATASEAAERGLSVWLQPRLGDCPEREILDHLAEAGRHAERMRRDGADVHLSVGCEFFLFVPGIAPGDTVMDRVENLLNGTYDRERLQRGMNRFVVQAAAVGRAVFDGPLTYGAAHDEEVDWDLFDVVSVNYYEHFGDRAGHVADLDRHLRWRKPVAITECGTCTYEGAPERGGMGWNVLDHSKPEPEIVEDLMRSEQTQAAYLEQVLEIFESMGLYAAMVWNFLDPESPHRSDPRRDLDMAGYSLVKVIRDDPNDPASPWHWQPKLAFHAVAERYRRARERDQLGVRRSRR